MDRIERLGLSPQERLFFLGGLSGTLGLFHGIVKGARVAGLRYLAENAHRLPRTKGTWYFFHKRKNYVLLKQGVNTGVATAFKYFTVTCLFFGVEAALDETFHKVSWMSTTGAAIVVGSGIAAWQQLSWRQSLRSVRNFAICGAVAGFVQDRVRLSSAISREKRAATQAEKAKEELAKEAAKEANATDYGATKGATNA